MNRFSSDFLRWRCNRLDDLLDDCLGDWLDDWLDDWLGDWLDDWLGDWLGDSIGFRFTFFALFLLVPVIGLEQLRQNNFTLANQLQCMAHFHARLHINLYHQLLSLKKINDYPHGIARLKCRAHDDETVSLLVKFVYSVFAVVVL